MGSVKEIRSRRSLGVCLALAALALVAPAAGFAAEPLTFVGFDKATLSPEAQEGMDEIFSGRCFHNALPVSVAKAFASANADATELGYDPQSPAGTYYSTDKIPSPPQRDADLALGESAFERDGALLTNGNCFSCHAGMVHGKVVAGLGNNRRTPPSRYTNGSKRPGMIQLLSMLTSDAEKKAFAATMASVMALNLNLPGEASRGDNFGPFAVWSVGARLADPERTGLLVSKEPTELTALFQSTMVPTVDPMPWWLMKYKERDYWYSDGGIYDAAHFSLNFTTANSEVNEHHAAHVASTAKALAFARETNSPLFPEPLDAEKVKLGADLFHGRTRPAQRRGFISCKTCHGTYTKKPSQPDLSQPGGWEVSYDRDRTIRNVKTDSAYSETLRKFKPIVDHINKLAVYYDNLGTPELTPIVSVPDKEGYIAPPLVGVWASAPYFHNGSVPTIATVLNSKERPGIWSRNISDPHAYNLEQVGLEYENLSRAEFEASAANAETAHFKSKTVIDHQSIYDTQSFGHANTGHTFGDNLSPEERAAVIEFLKSLSGPDM